MALHGRLRGLVLNVLVFFSWQLIHYKVLMNFKDVMKEERVVKECSRCRGAGWKASI